MKKAIATDLTPANLAKVLEVLRETPAQLESLSSGLSGEQLRKPLKAGERSFTENMAHLIYTESLSSEAIYLALMLEEPLIADVHAERQLGRLLRFDLLSFPELLAYFKVRRAVLLHVLESLTEAQWGRVIREEQKKRKESVYWRARGIAMHELDHLADLRMKLNGSGK